MVTAAVNPLVGSESDHTGTTDTPQLQKVLVHAGDLSALDTIRKDGGTLVADYGAFSLWRVGGAVGMHNLDVRDDLDQVQLRNTVINTAPGQEKRPATIPANLSQVRMSGSQFWMVQFVGPVKSEWLTALHQIGLSIVSYIPSDAYVVWGDGNALHALDALTARTSFIQWTGAYHPAYRLAPALQADLSAASRTQTDTWVDVTVQFYHTTSTEQSLQALLALGGAVRKGREDVAGFTNITLRLPVSRLAEVAGWPDVFDVEPWVPRRLMDESQGQIVAGNVISVTGAMIPSGPGYLAWLTSLGFPTTPDSYPVVDVVDDGLDQGIVSDILHPDFYPFGVLAGSSRVAYIANCTADLLGDSQGGHGNLNAGIVAGYNDLSGFPYTDTLGFHLGLGLSPYGRVAATKVFTNSTNPNSYDVSACGNTDAGVVAASYQHGADLTTNSWGAPAYGAYDAGARDYDALTRDAGNGQQMLHIFAAGNYGSGNYGSTVSSPGTAKNVLTVGATEGVRENGIVDGCGQWAAGNADNIATFSSRGPTSDGRVKPDLMAPGTHIQGPASQDSGYTGSSVCNPYHPAGQPLYTWSSGTSHSTPAVAGAVSLLWEYYQRVLNPGARPSPAMLKALLLNTPRYLTGTGAGDTLPSSNQGWGDVDLGALFDGVPRRLLDQNVVLTTTGQEYQTDGTILDPSRSFRVTLEWTDVPGSTTGNAYVNDLDLEVTVNGVLYNGNVFSGAYSTPGGTTDPRNNVESVFLPAGSAGSYRVRVVAANLACSALQNGCSTGVTDQDFALVIYNTTGAGDLQGRITDASSALPIDHALVRAESAARLVYTQTTGADGIYGLQVPSGIYTVTAYAYGYQPSADLPVSAASGLTTTQDITLALAGQYVISGTVLDRSTNSPLQATITITGDPFSPPVTQVNSDPTTGFYSLTVGGDQDYRLTASALLHESDSAWVTLGEAEATANFYLTPTTQSGGLMGTVRDYENGVPVPSATVALLPSGSPTATADANGFYQIMDIPPGRYEALVSAPFYSATQFGGIQVTTSSVTSRDFMLPHGILSFVPAELQRSLMLGSYADDSAGLIITNTGAGTLNVQLVESGTSLPDALPWLVESPAALTLAPSEAQVVSLIWSAAPGSGVSQPGIYTGRLQLANDDPSAQGAGIPVTFTVTPTPTQVQLQGVVSSSGMCQAQWVPINQASVLIQGPGAISATTTTDTDGHYAYYVSSGGVYTLTFGAPEHFMTTTVLMASAGSTVTHNATLRLNRPCIETLPSGLAVTVLQGFTRTLPLTITSAGPQPLNVALHQDAPPGAEVLGPDPYGYVVVSPTQYNFIEISGTLGATYMNPADLSAFTISTTFPLTFYGVKSNTLRVSNIGNSGTLLFGVKSGSTGPDNTALISATNNFLIAPFWDDLWNDQGGVWHAEIGAAPHRMLIVEWANLSHYVYSGGSSGTAGTITFEVIFYEDGDLLFQYKDVHFGDPAFDLGGSATVGIRGPGPDDSVQYSFDQAKLADRSAICFQSLAGADCSRVPWISAQPSSLWNLAGDPATDGLVNLTLGTTSPMAVGVYTTSLWLINNSPAPLITIPLTVTVAGVHGQAYIPFITR